jgi:hypothetical protein
MYKEFTAWSGDWNNLKSRKGSRNDIDDVLQQWKKGPPVQVLGRVFPNTIGYRKNSKGEPKGEQKIEQQLLGRKGDPLRVHAISGSTVENLAIYPIFNNFAAAKITAEIKGQIIADAFGILRVGSSFHPVSIEVKVDANHCWGAVVQNLQQVRFFRHAGSTFRAKMLNHAGDFVPKGKTLAGAWGIVIAPLGYWRAENRLKEAQTLLRTLTNTTKARILLAAINDEDGTIGLVGGHKFKE